MIGVAVIVVDLPSIVVSVAVIVVDLPSIVVAVVVIAFDLPSILVSVAVIVVDLPSIVVAVAVIAVDVVCIAFRRKYLLRHKRFFKFYYNFCVVNKSGLTSTKLLRMKRYKFIEHVALHPTRNVAHRMCKKDTIECIKTHNTSALIGETF